MKSGPNPAIGFAILAAYLAFIGLIIFLVFRWRRQRARDRDEAVAQGLTAAGARLVSTGPEGGYYAGTTREFEIGGQRVTTRTYPVSRYHYRFNLGVATPPLPGIMVIPEGLVDRVGKSLGLNREVQTGDQVFDDAAYIDTIEEDAPVKRVLEDAAVREGILGLLSLGYKVQLSVRGLEAFQLLPYGTAPDVSRVGEATAKLSQIAPALPTLDRSTFKGNIPFLWLRVLAFMLMWIPPLLLGGLLDALTSSPGARTLNMGHKGLIVGLGALAAYLSYVALVASWLRGHSYAFRALLVAAGFGLLGTPLCGVIGTLALNQGLDGSPAEERVATVTRTSKYKGECRLYVSAWDDPSREESLPVKCKHLPQLGKGTDVHLRVHSGALGMPWIEPIQFPE
jgi:hypothetical protein